MKRRGKPPKTPKAAKPVDSGVRDFVTPEGVDLRLRVASYAERCAAFLIDLAILLAVLIVMSLVLALAAQAMPSRYWTEAAAVIWMLGFFLLRNFYFVAFEMRPGAATPGKRAMGLRVVARGGGRLTADAILARNAMREIEVFLPLMFLIPRAMGIDAFLIALGAIWSGIFVLFPLFNRDRLRLGDLAAGAMVIKAPRRKLLQDLAQAAPMADPLFAFSEAQLDAYGIKELQVLETVLRTGQRRTLAEVANRIRAKIAWDGSTEVSDRAFLTAYYAALRGRLEGQLLFGRRRRDKFDQA